MGNDADLRFAHELADAADAVTMSRFRAADLRVETKPDLTPVSEADRKTEETIRQLVVQRGLGEGVFGEELGDDAKSTRWVVDPIDGTRNYVRGVPVWATLLALERDGVVDVAVVSAPALGRRWWASRGDGSHADGSPIRVSQIARLEDCVVSTAGAASMPPGWTELSRRVWSERGFGDFWQHCLVAEGAIDVAADPVLELWDYAAIGLLVAEAGGRCSTFTGGSPAPGASFLSTNAALHDDVVGLLG